MTNLEKRILSAVILAPIVLYITYIGGLAFNILVIIASFIMIFEWCNITKSSFKKHFWWIGGVAYILPTTIGLIYLNNSPYPLVLLILLAIWSVDIGAYIFGKTIGGAKIAPKISPNKTWAGLIGGIVFTEIYLLIILTYIKTDTGISLIFSPIIAIIFTTVAQTGDFFESWIKRKFGVKDSSNLIPGHGGLLDRLDGLLAIMLITNCYFYSISP